MKARRLRGDEVTQYPCICAVSFDGRRFGELDISVVSLVSLVALPQLGDQLPGLPQVGQEWWTCAHSEPGPDPLDTRKSTYERGQTIPLLGGHVAQAADHHPSRERGMPTKLGLRLGLSSLLLIAHPPVEFVRANSPPLFQAPRRGEYHALPEFF
jgi:hypothetical protein